jgi:surface protein
MNKLFYNCYSIISLELGNLDTSSVNDMAYMFYNCSSLKSLNLKSFDTSSILTYNNMFTNLLESFKYCINDGISENIILQLFSFSKTNCSELCHMNSKNNKYISEKNECINNCTEDDTYKFEYNDICYSLCPNLTHNLLNTYICEEDLICDKYYNYNQTGCLEEIPPGFYLNDSYRKTIDKCIIKCSSCNLESIQIGLCLKCNNVENYYQKYNDSSNFDSYVNCYNEKPFGFYLDNTDVDNIIYKPCYDTCNQSYYYYKINSILRELTNKFINSTFIYFSQG